MPLEAPWASISQWASGSPRAAARSTAARVVQPVAVTVTPVIWRGDRPIALSASRSRSPSRTVPPIVVSNSISPTSARTAISPRTTPRSGDSPSAGFATACTSRPSGPDAASRAATSSGSAPGRRRSWYRVGVRPGSFSRRVSREVETTRPAFSGSMLRPTMCRICGRSPTVIRTQSPTCTSSRSSSPCPATASSGPCARRPSARAYGYGSSRVPSPRSAIVAV